MGGNVRVGLEDSLWAGKGRLAQSNAEQVRSVRQIIEGLGLQIATPEDARRILQLRAATRWRSESKETGMRIEILADVKTTLGEGPLWDVDEQRLYWIDSFDGRVFRCTADGRELRAWDVPQKIGSMALRKQAGVVSLARGFHFLDFRSGEVELIVDPEPDKPANRLNDGKVDRQGRFYAGSMDTQEAGPNGALYRLDPDLSLHRLDTGIVVSNGPCWSPDGRTFYFADTWSGEIWAYDCDPASGAISNRRTFTRVDMSGGGAADGSTVDAEGYLWNAQVYDGKLVRYAPDGSVDRVIEMPVKKVTSVMFGGPELDVLYVTSMAKPPLPRFPQDGVARGSCSRCTGWACAACPSRASAVEAAGRVLAPPALAWRRVQSPDPPSRLPSSAARQSASGAMPRASSATAAASTRASGGISASTRTSPKRSMASLLPGDSGPLMTTPSTGMPRRRSASRLSSVWLMVPRPLRAASTTGMPSRAIRSIIMCRSSIGTYRPPAPSTISGASVSGGTMVVASSSASSSGAAAQGDSGACNT